MNVFKKTVGWIFEHLVMTWEGKETHIFTCGAILKKESNLFTSECYNKIRKVLCFRKWVFFYEMGF